MKVWRTGFPKWGSQCRAVPPHGGRLRYVFYGKASKVPFRPRVAGLQGGTPYFCRGQAPEKAWTDLWLVAGHMSIREWATLNVSYQSLDAGYISSGELGLLRRRIGWMSGIPSGLVPEKGLSRYGGLVDGISKVGFPRWGRSAARGQASVRLLWQGFQGSVQPTGGRPPRWNPSTFNIIE